MNSKYKKRADEINDDILNLLVLGTLVVIGLLLIAIFSKRIDFITLRAVVTLLCLSYVIGLFRRGMYISLIIYLIFAVIFNPLIRFHFERPVWQIIDAALVSFLVLSFIYEYRLDKKFLAWQKKQNREKEG